MIGGDRVRRLPEGLQCQHRSGTHGKWPVCNPLLTDQTCWVGLKTAILPCSWEGASGLRARVSWFFQWPPKAF